MQTVGHPEKAEADPVGGISLCFVEEAPFEPKKNRPKAVCFTMRWWSISGSNR